MTAFVLVPGASLGGWAWRQVARELRAAGHDAYPMTLTGLAERRHLGGPGTDLETHITDITALVEAEELDAPVLVAHGYAGAPVTGAADRLGDRIKQVIYVDGGGLPDGATFAELIPVKYRRASGSAEDGWWLPPRPFVSDTDPVNLAGLSEADLARLRRLATPHPYATMTQPLGLSGKPLPPAALIVCTMQSAKVRALLESGYPYDTTLADAPLLQLPTGHYPMFSEPARLTELLIQLS